MGKVAFSEIRYGAADGKVTVIKEGEVVKGLPNAVMKDLEASGILGDEPKAASEATEEISTLRAEVEQLRAQLAEASSNDSDKTSDKTETK